MLINILLDYLTIQTLKWLNKKKHIKYMLIQSVLHLQT